MTYKNILIVPLVPFFLLLNGCSDTPQQTTIIKTEETAKVTSHQTTVIKKIYTLDEIYTTMCIQCHSSDGSGNTEKLTPSMKHFTETEIEKALLDIENDKGHIIMEHNRGEILKMGMQYPAKDMAKYMFQKFSK